MDEVVLHPGRDRSVRRRHPWLLSGAIATVRGEPAPGDTVRVVSSEGEALGVGHYSPRSEIRVRLFHFGKEEPSETWLAERIEGAIGWRVGHPLLASTDALRLVNAEGDGIPGLVVDRYADVVVVRASAAGMFKRSAEVAEGVRRATNARAGWWRDDATAARREGFAPRQQPLWGDPPSDPIEICERGRRYRVDLSAGQKTGFYLDQRDARDLVQVLAPGARVLDLFAYSGGFSVAAVRGGAQRVVLVDSSRSALALAQGHLERAAAREAEVVCGDAFRFLRDRSESFDLVVIDPPPLARRKSDVARAARSYKDLLLHALRRAASGAHVLGFACSHHMDPALFRKVAFGAALDAGRAVQVLRTLEASPDHPVSLDHPEGRYLTGLLLRVP